MRKIDKIKTWITATRLYAIIGCVFIIFLLSMSLFQKVEVYKVREKDKYKVVENENISEIADEATPIGIRQQYSWTLDDVGQGERVLAFYTVHQYAEVYFDGELMYSLNLQKENKIGQTTGNNWVVIPIYPEDAGKEISVNIIPVYRQVRNRETTFFIGSKFEIYLNQFKSDLPQITLSLLSVLVGIVFVIISIICRYKMRENHSLGHLGVFSMAIGIWKLTDIRFAPLMFPQNTMAVSYISISMITLGIVPLMMVIKKQFLEKYYRFIEWICIVYCGVATVIITFQVTNIADFRETLYMAHISIAIAALLIVSIVFYEAKKNLLNKRVKTIYIYLLLCIFGAVADMAIYYIQGHSAGILCTLTAFLIYIISMGYMSIREINYKANIDMHTGLFNKSRCNEILDENEISGNLAGVIMFDLNYLKYTNDTLGHEKGDILISEFAYILRENISTKNFIGRYGGDEFIVVIKRADGAEMNKIKQAIAKDVTRYNLINNKIPISYSMGYALAIDYPSFTLRQLLEKADEHMYIDKKAYHNSKEKKSNLL